MGPLERRIKQHIAPGSVLKSIPGKARFQIESLEGDALMLLLGQMKNKTPLPWDGVEGIPAFLRGRDWVRIGAVKESSSIPGTLDQYLKENLTKRMTAGYVARILVDAGIVEADPEPPAKVRLLG